MLALRPLSVAFATPGLEGRKEVTSVRSRLNMSLQPEASARLQGHSEGCTITYSATSIYLNKRLLAETDFLKFREEEARGVILAIPPKTL
jgi:hypothetical protein